MGEGLWKWNYSRKAILFIVILCIVLFVTIGIINSIRQLKRNERRNKETLDNKGNVTENNTIEKKSKKSYQKLKKIAQSIQASMDSSIDPCQDFYKFTCGNFSVNYTDIGIFSKFASLQIEVLRKVKEALDKKARQSKLPSSQKKLVDAYSSCFHKRNQSAQIRELWSLLKEIGGWPMGDKTWNPRKYNLAVAVATAIKITGMTPLIGFDVLPDMKNTTRNIISLSAPSMINNGLTQFAEFLLYVARSSRSFKFSTFYDDVVGISSLEKELRKIIDESPQTSEDKYNRFQIKNLNIVIKEVDIIRFFQIITNSSLNHMNQYLTEDDYVEITNLWYLKKLEALIQSNKFPLRAYANYIGARIVLETTLLVSSAVSPLGYSYPRQNVVYSKAPTNWYHCLSTLSARLNYVTDRIYVDYLGERAKDDEAIKMLDHIVQAFESLAEKSDWLDNDTLSAAMEKLHAMRKHIGYPNWILDNEKLDYYYRTLPDMGYYFSENIKKISEFVMDKLLKQLRQINKLNEWPNIAGLTITAVNAFYIPPFNSICLPLAIQNIPLYDPAMPWYLNFGAMGSIIGHEITHGFDSQGRNRDKNGNFYNWWSKNASEDFKEKAECFVEQYSYDDPQTNIQVNGTQTLSENIADNGGLRQAYLAYQMWEKEFGKEEPLPGLEKYTPHQLLFISYGSMWCAKLEESEMKRSLKKDEHTPSPYRVWGAVSNSREFSETFHCVPGKKMNPGNKCIIW